MNLLADVIARLRSLFRRGREDAETQDELRFHLEMETEKNLRAGMGPREARRQAHVRLGGVDAVREAVRDARGLRLADEAGHIMTNIRLALRMLLKTPVVTGVAVVSLALGIGSNTAIFSLYSQLLLRPLPVADPDGLVNLAAPGPKPGPCSRDNAGTCDETFSYPMFRDLERGQQVFTSIAAHKGLRANVAHQGRTALVQGTQVSGSYFATLGLLPAAGRLFGPEVDGAIGGHPVVVLSHDFWQSEFGGHSLHRRRLAGDGGPLRDVPRAPRHPCGPDCRAQGRGRPARRQPVGGPLPAGSRGVAARPGPDAAACGLS